MKLQGIEVGLKISTTRPCSILDKVLMGLVEVDLGLGLSLITPIIQLIMLDHLVFIVMVIKKLGIVLTIAKFLHITMVE